MFSGLPHKADSSGSPRHVAVGPHPDMDGCYFLIANGFVTSRAHSMKRSARGFNVRFRGVTTTAGQGRCGRSTDSALRPYRAALRRSTEFAKTVMWSLSATRWLRSGTDNVNRLPFGIFSPRCSYASAKRE